MTKEELIKIIDQLESNKSKCKSDEKKAEYRSMLLPLYLELQKIEAKEEKKMSAKNKIENGVGAIGSFVGKAYGDAKDLLSEEGLTDEEKEENAAKFEDAAKSAVSTGFEVAQTGISYGKKFIDDVRNMKKNK